MRKRIDHQSAFTLIELLIVVAIIGILAAIAVPNFLQAQTRAKVAKAVSNMKSIQTALEMYQLDKGTYTRWAWDSSNPAVDYMGFRDLTTPVSYISGGDAFRNPFRAKHLKGNLDSSQGELDPFFELGTWKSTGNKFDRTVWPRNAWLLESSGPDTVDSYNANNYPQLGNIYQSSNGVMSWGDIYRAGGANVPAWAATLTY